MSVNRPLGATPRSGSLELPGALRGSRTVATPWVGLLALALVVGCVTTISVAASGTNSLLPQSIRPVPSSLHLAGAFGGSHLHLSSGFVLGVFTLLFAAYVFAVRSADRLAPRTVLLAIAAVTAAVLLAPPLVSTDVFSYEAYARMWDVYAANPYVHGPQIMSSSDPVYPFIGENWINTPTVYGPLFTLLSDFLGRAFGGFGSYASIAAGAYAFKLIAAAASLTTVALLWSTARLRGVDPVRAVALFGLNPLILLYGVGGGHNDLLMVALSTAGIWAVLAHRERASGAMIVLGAAVKLTGLLLLPFALLSGVGLGARRRHVAIAVGGLLAALACIALGAAFFGTGPLMMIGTLRRVQAQGSDESVPGIVALIPGLLQVGHILGYVLAAVFLGVCTWLLHRVWRGRMDWIDGAGWATFALLVTASAVLPWYVAWLLPLAALCTRRRLVTAALWLSGVVQLTTMLAYLPGPHPILGF